MVCVTGQKMEVLILIQKGDSVKHCLQETNFSQDT